MVSRSVVVRAAEGIHARPAAEIVRTANQFQSQVSLRVGDEIVNAKSVLSIMKLAIPTGTEVELLAEGVDEESALDALTNVLLNL